MATMSTAIGALAIGAFTAGAVGAQAASADGSKRVSCTNGTEDNVVLWTFNKGVRRFVKRGAESVPLELGTWHTLRVAVHGTALQAWLDDKLMLEHTLTEPVSGKIGVWSKTDSMTEFDDF